MSQPSQESILRNIIRRLEKDLESSKQDVAFYKMQVDYYRNELESNRTEIRLLKKILEKYFMVYFLVFWVCLLSPFPFLVLGDLLQ